MTAEHFEMTLHRGLPCVAVPAKDGTRLLYPIMPWCRKIIVDGKVIWDVDDKTVWEAKP